MAHYNGGDWNPVDRAVEAGTEAEVPVMIDFGGHFPPLSLDDLLNKHLRPGDILTHMYGHVRGRFPIVNEQGQVEPYVIAARKRGVIFDVGHGGGSFLWRQAVPATKQGFFPDVISTDLHTGSENAGMKDILNVMSKIMNLGHAAEGRDRGQHRRRRRRSSSATTSATSASAPRPTSRCSRCARATSGSSIRPAGA